MRICYECDGCQDHCICAQFGGSKSLFRDGYACEICVTDNDRASMKAASQKRQEESYIHFSDMAWPAIGERIGEVEWNLRYGEPSREDLLFAASVLVAYATLARETSTRRNRICAKLTTCK